VADSAATPGVRSGSLGPGWRVAVILVLIVGFSVLLWLAGRTYRDAPPVPDSVIGPSGATIFTGDDIRAGQQVFLKHGLMENGTVWGHGGYLGPDFPAAYLHALALCVGDDVAQRRFGRKLVQLGPVDRAAADAETALTLKQNRYSPGAGVLRFSDAEARAYREQTGVWASYFADPRNSGGLSAGSVRDPDEVAHLTAFFAWAAWASSAERPGRAYSYTNNFPFDPMAGNTPPADALLWSALSLVTLLGGTALVLFSFGKFDYLGWRSGRSGQRAGLVPGEMSTAQKPMLKYFVLAAALLAGQTLVGGALAHYRSDPGSFYGIDLSRLLPSNIMRTWHLQLGVFWIATAYVAGGLFLAPVLGRSKPRGQTGWTNVLFIALGVVVSGSLLGEALGVNGVLGRLWNLLGHQGWEYLDLGRMWQVLLAGGLALWLVLLYRAAAPARRDPERAEVTNLFLLAAVAIPLFYLPALFFKSTTNYAVVDMWRFWIIHMWVEGFFELFVTVMVVVVFHQLGIISRLTATRVVYLDAILYLGSGIVGTGHHWYWTGQSNVTMALGALFSAMEVVPLTLLTLDAWDFVKLTQGSCETCGADLSRAHKWTFHFLIAVGVWNFIGAGVFGFLINLPIVSYYEVGTLLTPNHGHAAMMGVFGMLAASLIVLALRQASPGDKWPRVERWVRVSFWGLNAGLALMVITNLFPGGVAQLLDVLHNGYWHARSPEFLSRGVMHTIEWARLAGDLVFIALGAVPLLVAALMVYRNVVGNGATSGAGLLRRIASDLTEGIRDALGPAARTQQDN